jgi:hypothetical protein
MQLIAVRDESERKKVRLGQLKLWKINGNEQRRGIMSLRKFREFIQDGHGPASRGSELKGLREETYESEITDAATVIIGNELAASERRLLVDGFVNDVRR